MNVTSVLSKGYLEPVRNGTPAIAERSDSASLAAQERQILAQERTLKTASGIGTQVSTTYRYTVGPDGRRYITGAEVTIRGEEDAVDRIGGGVKRAVLNPASGETKPKEEETGGETSAKTGEDLEDGVIRELKQIEREVVAHEAAHQAAGGRFAGAVSYAYTRGPDGHAYITGGEVPIHVPPGGDPEQTVRDMEQVQRAALAPASPSGQDRAVAAQAVAAAARARQEIAVSGAPNSEARTGSEYRTQDASGQNTSGAEPGAFRTGVASARAELLRNRVQSASEAERTETVRANGANGLVDLGEVYARAASPLGLWALGRGFDEMPAPKEQESGFFFDIAA
jgi:hypothetical protein